MNANILYIFLVITFRAGCSSSHESNAAPASIAEQIDRFFDCRTSTAQLGDCLQKKFSRTSKDQLLLFIREKASKNNMVSVETRENSIFVNFRVPNGGDQKLSDRVVSIGFVYDNAGSLIRAGYAGGSSSVP